jgi:hypothetical protein
MHRNCFNTKFRLDAKHCPRFIEQGVCAVLALVLAWCMTAESAKSSDNTPMEYEVKAAYIYYLAKFVNWPDTAFAAQNEPIVIGVFGDDAFGSMLKLIVKSKRAQNHPINVQLLKRPADCRNCHMIFISTSELKRFRQIYESLQEQSVLIVTEADTNSSSKGIVNFFMEAGKVQFEVDIARAEKAGLQVSSKLLRLARGATANPLGKGE